MKKQFIAGNWKMNLTLEKAKALVKELCNGLADSEAVDVGIFPSFVYLKDICDILKGHNVFVGAQNMNMEKSGAFTGEVSGEMLRDIGCTHVIVGHSERRAIYQETNSMVNAKIKAALSNDLCPILCVGESQEERDADKTREIVEGQLSGGLEDLTSEQVEGLTIAYEPVWAIGTGKTATPEQANEVHAFIRNIIRSKYNDDTAQSIRIQYGGSVNSKNAKDLLGQPEIDGALVGGASLDSNSFLDIVSEAVKFS
ncbi:MAG: triose-phosphate isomerase [Candidatus Scalindua sp.]|jgi:triosephosphate isomerase|nr:triose-phosphate isomerase [Candidatus Scalindua sp.]MBT5306349.1 triose-phosphate isomerase [Candidatus Scalindua sp.]MBT6046286.1 triose-phosphate isomerase [Candidatus Scalindua sp.]MBT6226640.1 triose-phosphate isomerase [Candidatus Scalindua sp.]MBT6564189.1 triose-phosphate isomerase [Candidatus Scalindua sp.]